MKIALGKNLPKKALAYAAFSLIAVLGFCLVVIIPNGLDLIDTDQKIAATREDIEKQKLLVPVFLELTDVIKEQVLPKDAQAGPKKLSEEDVADISGLMGDLADKAGVGLVSAIANPDSLDNEMRLSIRVVARGELSDLRQFLVALGTRNYLDKIERITLARKDDAAELAVTVWVGRK